MSHILYVALDYKGGYIWQSSLNDIPKICVFHCTEVTSQKKKKSTEL